MDARHKLCTTIYSCSFSPCGKYLAAGTNFGYIAIFDFDNVLRNDDCESRKSIFAFKGHSGPIHSLVTKDNLLISGGYGPVAVWRWADVLEQKPAKIASLDEPCIASESSFLSSDVNALASNDKKLFAGRDDNVVCIWDLEAGVCDQKLLGHSDYIHGVAAIPLTHGVASCSEDGAVKIWDLRMSEAATTFEPHTNEDLARPQFGKWIGSIAVSENGQWMACGGGPHLSLWHLRSQSLAAVLEKPDCIPYTIEFHDNIVVAGGNGETLHHWYTNGKHKSSIPCSIGTVFCVALNRSQKHDDAPMVAAGTSHKLDVFCNLSYRSHTLAL